MSADRKEFSTTEGEAPKTFPAMSTSMQQLPRSKGLESFEQKLWRKVSLLHHMS